MEDADKNSKSLVLITRVGSTPTIGTKKSYIRLPVEEVAERA